jgi:hypothetical protein
MKTILLLIIGLAFTVVSNTTDIELPTKTIVKTAIGGFLAVEGIVGITIGAILLCKYRGTSGNLDYAIEASMYTALGWIGVIEGTCAITPGIILLTSASQDWKHYKSTQDSESHISQSIPGLSVTISF